MCVATLKKIKANMCVFFCTSTKYTFVR